ncbi:MAG: serine protease, partial [Nitrospinaceae bacterium]|nr:trypsin-like peptidase domain-containing protein [Nitrospinaceae bacterium]NIR55899.1 trypsin-like peptidase domain-containing protein [Nitrospinaceae bacterium]NIU45390.1 trypsin-like peptidase domain-containing protein [Nitrospinaceae bacterium]NIU97544.1 serine protease [Nitrospinaceae bacterium]NIW06967.1 serine protease [Nitrospinaceae bacterium]
MYVLGFPMGIMAPERQYVIARSGIIARIRDTLEKRGHDFLIDAMVFPGNSGSPVISKPEIISIQGTPSLPKPCLIGIVVSYLTYKDTALSQQTGQPRVIFEENSGLA